MATATATARKANGKGRTTAAILKLSTASPEQVEAAVTHGEIEPQEAPAEETVTDKENRGAGKSQDREVREFSDADPAETLGRLLIAEHYPHLQHVRMVYVFTNESMKEAKVESAVKAIKVHGLNAWLAQLWNPVESTAGPGDPFFVILIAQPFWDAMDAKTRLRNLDLAIWQCDKGGTGSLKLRKPEIRTSVEVLHRHGPMTNREKDAAAVLLKWSQGELPLEEAS